MKLSQLVLAVALHLTLSSVGWGLQLSDIRNQVRLRLRDTASDTNFQRFSDANLNLFINEAQRDFINRTWLLTNTTAFDLVSSTPTYYLPSDTLVTYRVTVSSRMIGETNYNSLDQDQTNWTTATSTPTSYLVTNWDIASTSPTITFFPMPKASSYGNQVVVYYIQRPVDLVSDTDVPFRGKQAYWVYHDALVDYVSCTLWTILGRLDYAGYYLQLYTAKTALAFKNLNTEPNFNPGFRGDRGPRQ